MKFTLRKVGLAAAATVFGLTLFATPSYSASGEEIIEARIKFMKDDVEGLWKPLAAYAKSGTGSLADVEKSARAMAKIAEKLPEHFPKDTGRGKYPEKMTRSLPLIWSDADGFKKAIQYLSEESDKLARLAKEGNKDAVVSMIGTSGSYARTKIGCAECHDKFRGSRS